MKVVARVNGIVQVRAHADDVTPEGGALQRDVVDLVAGAYGFSVKPIIPPGATPEMFPVLNFQTGKVAIGDQIYPIYQLAMSQHHDTINAATTEIADLIFDDLKSRLDKGMNYRYGSTAWPKTYTSGVIVQFDAALEEKITFFHRVEEILGREIPRENLPFKPKTLSFGAGDPLPMGGVSIDDIHASDFILQRRVGSPYSENRYYSNMPATTTDHIRILELIEAAARN